MENQVNIERFESFLSEIDRSGSDKLFEYIRGSDFYTAPASTRYHSCHSGGLLEHSLNVAECLLNKLNNPVWSNILNDVGRESILVCALLHDICKANFYGVEMRNKKIYSENGKKIDSNGRYDWESVPYYIMEDKMPLGHGEKSVMILDDFIKLKPVERYAIRWHMLFTEPKELYGTIGVAIRKHPLCLALSQADLESTYLLEKEE